MKKILFSAAAFSVVAVSAVAVAPTTSEAIPAFARQTSAACLSCHFQSFPTLSAFGRAFKMGALTDVGDQGLVEDEELSIPATLNATVVFRPQVASVKTTGAPTAKSISYGDQVVLIGGRIGHNVGAFVELGGGAFGNHQLFTSFELGDFRGGINYANTGFGTDAALQLGNTWGQHGGMMNGRVTSANQAIEQGATGLGVAAGQYASAVAWVGNDMGAIQFGLVAPSLDAATFGGGAGGGTFTAAKIVRANTFFDAGGMTAGVGATWIGGKVGANNQYVPGQLEMKRWGVEASLEGELGDSQIGLYLDYANARKSTLATTNVFNSDTLNNLKGFGVRGTIKPLHNVVLMAGYGNLKATSTYKTTTFGAEYEFYQNFVISLTFTDQKTTTAGASTTTKTTLLDFEALM